MWSNGGSVEVGLTNVVGTQTMNIFIIYSLYIPITVKDHLHLIVCCRLTKVKESSVMICLQSVKHVTSIFLTTAGEGLLLKSLTIILGRRSMHCFQEYI